MSLRARSREVRPYGGTGEGRGKLCGDQREKQVVKGKRAVFHGARQQPWGNSLALTTIMAPAPKKPGSANNTKTTPSMIRDIVINSPISNTSESLPATPSPSLPTLPPVSDLAGLPAAQALDELINILHGRDVNGNTKNIGHKQRARCMDLAMRLKDVFNEQHAVPPAAPPVPPQQPDFESTLRRVLAEYLPANNAQPPAGIQPPQAAPYSYAVAAKMDQPRPQPRELQVTVSLTKVEQGHVIRKASPGEAKAMVEKAIRECGEGSLRDMKIHGVRQTPSSLIVQAHHEEDAAAIERHSSAWTAKLASGSSVARKTWAIEISSVSLDFDPHDPSSIAHLVNANPTTIPSSDLIASIRWLNERRIKELKKTHSTLVLALRDERTADRLIYKGVSVAGQLCTAHIHVPSPTQCYTCQAFGHQSAACPHRNDPSKLTCARCAGNHRTKECVCAHTPPTAVGA